MTCNRFRALVQQRFDQDLTTQDHRALINHLEGCESCSKFDHQLDQMIQAAQDTPAPDEVRPQNPEALARLIMEQLPQKKNSIVGMIMGVFAGGGGGAKAPKAKGGKGAKDAMDDMGGGAIKDKLKSKGKGKGNKDGFGDDNNRADVRPGGMAFGRKREESFDSDAIESQVGTFSRLKSISSNRTPEQLDREAQSTTRSLGEKFGMAGASSGLMEDGPLTLAESIKRKVSESQKLSPLDDDNEASGALIPVTDNGGNFGRDNSGDGGGGGWGPPAFAGRQEAGGAGGFTSNQQQADNDAWGAPSSGGMVPSFAQAAQSGAMGGPGSTNSGMPGQMPGGFDQHPGSAIGLAPPTQQRNAPEGGKAGIGLGPTPAASNDWGGAPATPAAPASGGWGATDTSKATGEGGVTNWGGVAPAPAQTAQAAPSQAPAQEGGWTSGWGGEGQNAPLKSSDSWAVPGSESTNSWGQPAEGSVSADMPQPAAMPGATGADPWSPPTGAWGAGQAAADAANAAAAASQNALPAQAPLTQQPAADAWGSTTNSGNASPWGGTPAQAEAPTGQPAAQANDAWGAPAQSNSAWGGGDAAEASGNAAPAQPAAQANDAWGAAPAQPAAQANDAWGAPAQPAAQANDAWGAAPAQPAAQANDAWGAPAQPAAQANDAWGAAPAQPAAQANDAWGAAPAQQAATPTSSSDAWNAAASSAGGDAWGAAPAQPAAPANDAWGAAPAQPAAPAAESNQPADPWSTAAGAEPPVVSGAMATGYATIPPGQFATPANAGSAIASSGWGQSPVPPAGAPSALDNNQIEAKKNQWAAEAEQLETGTWRAFAPKMNQDLGAKAPAAPAPAAPSGDRWDVPIQERSKTLADQPDAPIVPGMPAPLPGTSGLGGLPPSPVAPMQAAAPGPDTQGRWDVPIQERRQDEGAPQAAPAPMNIGMPPGAVGSPVGGTGIPVNQIVEKMGQVLGAPAAGASSSDQESRWDVPIQERMKAGQSQEIQPVQPAAQAAPAWGQPASFEAPQPAAAQPAAEGNGWGAPAASGWGEPAPATAGSGWDAAPPAAPAAPAASSGWGTGEASLPTPQPTSSWGQPAGNGWGEPAANNSQQNPAVSQNQAPVSSGWGSPAADTTGNGGGNAWSTPAQAAQPVAASNWGAPAPQEPPAPPKAEITDKVQAGGLLTGIDDKAIDRIFGEIGVQESVSKTVVNSGGTSEPVSNFSPPAAPAQPMAAPAVFAQATAPEAPKGLLGGIDDNAIDRIFSQNLGVSESSVPVGKAAEMAAPVAVASSGWGMAPAAAPAPAPTAAEVAQSTGWGAPLPPASSGWNMPATPMPEAPPEAAPSAGSGWGVPAAAPGGWGMPPAPPAMPEMPAAPAAFAQPGGFAQPNFAEPQPGASPKLFSVDDSVMDRIFSDNVGIAQDANAQYGRSIQENQAQAAQAVGHAPAQPVHPTMQEMEQPNVAFQGGPPPKIAGIGRLDSSADPNQDAGSGRIASIGKFLLDQKDLDKIGKLTNTDNSDGKLRILTKENSDDLQGLLGQIGAQVGVVGSVIVGHDGLLIANTMPSDMDAESVGVWALGVYMNTEHVTKKMGHDRVHQVVSRTPRGYVIIADFGGGLLVCVTEGTTTDSLIPLMRTITQLVN